MTEHTLTSLLKAIGYPPVIDSDEVIIRGIATDSREVRPGWAFIAIRGTVTDGNRYIGQAVENGAVLVLSEIAWVPDFKMDKERWVQIEDARKVTSLVAEWFYGYPSREVTLVGVTGTNGKTSTVYLLHQLFVKLGYRAGMFSTIVNKNHEEEMPARLTTPDPVSLSRDLAAMVANGCDYVFMEVSSHALDQNRVHALDFDVAIFANITHDHLDYHETFAHYIRAKKSFFDHLKSDAIALINEDDRNGEVMVQNTRAKVKTYGLTGLADYSCQILHVDHTVMTLRLGGREMITRLTGRFNAYNLTAAYAVADLCDLDTDETLRFLSDLEEVPGRFQRVKGISRGPLGIVDYAHTPDAVEKVTQAAAEIVSGDGRILIVLGCGGNRDREKRPEMARVAAKNADLVILTSDNPRDEDPDQIIAEMYDDLDPVSKSKTFRITDRQEAIRMAVSMAYPEDVVVVAGKGHERYQEIKGVKRPFDDRYELEQALVQKVKR